ncbi:MAG: ATP-binding protein [Allosphingosinicella sp.]
MSCPIRKLGIERLLKQAPPGMRNHNFVILEDDWPSVAEMVARGVEEPALRFDLLIAEFRLPGSLSFAAIHAIDPTLSVMDVDLPRGTSHTLMLEAGSKNHVCAEWLARESGLTSRPAEAAELAGHFDGEAGEGEAEASESPPGPPAPEAPEEAKALVPPVRPRLVLAPPSPSPPDADTQLGDLARWLELKLGIMLARAETWHQGQDFPGWTMSAARARALLGSDIAKLPAEALQEQWQRVDERLRAHVDEAAHKQPSASPGWIAHAFGLDRIECEMLWLVAAPDMSGGFAQAIGFLNDDLGQRRPTLSLLSRMIDGAGPPWRLRHRLAGEAPFATFRLASLVRPDPLTPESLAPVVAAPDIVAMLLGRGPGDVVEGATLFDPADFGRERFNPQVTPILDAARTVDRDRQAPIIQFHAPAHEADWLAAQLAWAKKSALVGDIASAAGADPGGIDDRLYAFARAARIADAVLIVTGADELPETRREELAGLLAGQLAPHLRLVTLQGLHTTPLSLRAAAGGVLEISRPRPTREERAAIWTRAADDRGLALSDEDARGMGATFAFDRTQAEAAVALAQGSGAIETPETRDATLREAARIVSRATAPASVRRIETSLGWDDLILPQAVKAQLKSIPMQVTHALTVWETWGFGERIPYGQATIALLAGPSGTGKTMAAQIIAGELGAALFQVDLAKTVSKYIGETEKILDLVFEAARNSSAVLLLDEADALLGKRTEIRDSHDRYANIQVNYLLQRIEEHDGLVLLTTNRKANLDSAFLRRLSAVIDLPMPDEGLRKQIWDRMIPSDAKVAPDVDLSAFSQLPLSGGGIVNAVLAAAFHAAEDGGEIRMHHLVAGARGELAKSGMESAGRGLTHLISGGRASGGAP